MDKSKPLKGKILNCWCLPHSLLKGNIAIAISQNLHTLSGAFDTSVQADILMLCVNSRSPSGKNTKIQEIQSDSENERLYKDTSQSCEENLSYTWLV